MHRFTRIQAFGDNFGGDRQRMVFRLFDDFLLLFKALSSNLEKGFRNKLFLCKYCYAKWIGNMVLGSMRYMCADILLR